MEERWTEGRCGITAYEAAEPYPEVTVTGRNLRYARAMLSNVGGGNSEMTAVALYFYDHLVTWETPEVAEVFMRIDKVEMHHLRIFGELARMLGVDPRLWCRQNGRPVWWTPGYLQYAQHLGPLLRVAIREEEGAIRKYEEQMEWIRDVHVVKNLRRIIQDEEVHLEIFRELLRSYGGARILPGDPGKGPAFGG